MVLLGGIPAAHGPAMLRGVAALRGGEQQQFTFIEHHPIIRNLTEYGDLVRTAFTTTDVAGSSLTNEVAL